jgi:hypothetical protein
MGHEPCPATGAELRSVLGEVCDFLDAWGDTLTPEQAEEANCFRDYIRDYVPFGQTARTRHLV